MGKKSTCNAGGAGKTRVQSLGHQDLLEEGKATRSSILNWRIPQTEEPGGIQSLGLLGEAH